MPATALRQGPDAAETRVLKRVCLLRLVQRMGRAVCILLLLVWRRGRMWYVQERLVEWSPLRGVCGSGSGILQRGF
jgi:hypothetical protein